MRQGRHWNARRFVALGLVGGALGGAITFSRANAAPVDDGEVPTEAIEVSQSLLTMIASPDPFEVTQPDGSEFNAVMKGNGEVSWYDTEDGYAITQDADGVWTYAQGLNADGELLPSDARPDENDKPPAAPTLQPAPPADTQEAPAFNEPAPAEAPPVQHQGTARSLVILASFSDTGPTTQPSYWSNLFFGASGSLDDFYEQASYGALRFQPAADSSGANDGVVGWVNVGFPHPDLGSGKTSNSGATIQAALVAANPYVDFTAYDTNGNNVIDNRELHVTVIMAGKESSVGGSNNCAGNGVWGHKSNLGQPPVLDGKYVGGWGFTTFGEMHCRAPGNQNGATLGIVAHEIGHDIGWPDLYDSGHDSVGGVGEWSLMAFGSWNTAGVGPSGNSPALPDPFLKSMQGWVTPVQVGNGTNSSVLAASSNADVKRVLANPNGVDWNFGGSSGTGEYFLIENRSRTGYDAGLPGCGILIWHIDESVVSTNAANADNAHRLVELEQADGRFDLNAPELSDRGDGGDAWPGTAARTVFGPSSTPNSNLYSGAASGATVTVTSTNCGSTMNFTIGSGGGAVPPVNDNFAAATTIAPTATATGSTTLATVETNELLHAANRGGKSVWWKVTPATSGSLTVDTETSNFDTLLGVYTGVAVNSLTPRAENDDTATTNQSRVQLDVVAGTTYYIAVDGWRNADTDAVSSGAVTLHTTFSASAVAAPVNDAFASATTINVASGATAYAQGPSFGATKEVSEPNHAGVGGGSSVWWKVTAPSAGTLAISTESSGFDSLLGVYTGASVGALTAIASNDDEDKPHNILTSRVTAFAVTEGVTYYIAVDGFANAEGYVRLQALFNAGATPSAPSAPGTPVATTGPTGVTVAWPAPLSDGGSPITGYTVTASPGGAQVVGTSPVTFTSLEPGAYTFTVTAANGVGTGPASPPSNAATVTATAPANDNFANAATISAVAGSTVSANGTNVGATLEPDERHHASNGGGASVWWKVTPAANGSLTVSTQGSGLDTLLGIYTGTAADNVVARAENDDAPGLGLQSRVQVNVSAGTTYYIAVDGYRPAEQGPSTGPVTVNAALSTSPLPPPVNDNFASAITLPVTSSVATSTTGLSFGASKQSGEPNHAGFNGGSSVWWKIIPPANGSLTLSTAASGFDSLLAVYTGTAVNALTAVPGASNDDQSNADGILTSVVAPFPVTGGVTYYVAVDGFAGSQASIKLQALYTQAATAAVAPGAPTGVLASAGDTTAMVTWSAPVSDGGAPITGYTVTASNGGATCGWTSGPMSCAVGGLTNGQSYTFTVTATNSAGTGPASPASNAVTPLDPAVPGGDGFVPLSPARVLETRPGLSTVDGGYNGIGAVGAGQVLNLTVTGRAGVPTSGVGAVVVNVTATEPTGNGFLTVFPAGSTRPTASNLNFTVGRTIPNLVVAKVGASGQISIYNHAGSTHVIVDVVGWFPDGDSFSALSPARVLETRPGLSTVDGGYNGIGAVGAGQVLNLTVTGRAGVPTSGVGAVVVNVTATEPTGNGFLTVFPAGSTRPTASNLNFTVGRTIPNLVVAKVGASGQISIYNHAGSTHVIVDVVGWFPDGDSFSALSPARVLETRPGLSTVDGGYNGIGAVGAGQVLNLTVTGRAGVPTSGVGAVVVNVTATEPTGNGFLTVFPAGSTRPTASNLNFTVGQTIPNLVVAKVGASGQISIYNHAGSTHVIVDVVGWFPA